MVRKKRDASINLGHGPGETGPGHRRVLGRQFRGGDGLGHLPAGPAQGIDRPAIGALFPTRDPEQQVLVLDVGANMDCKPEWLHQFALLGNIYSRDVLQVATPRASAW